jgi:hypothetical protein
VTFTVLWAFSSAPGVEATKGLSVDEQGLLKELFAPLPVCSNLERQVPVGTRCKACVRQVISRKCASHPA